MKIERVAKIGGGQDGAICGNELFRLDHKGNCTVYDLSSLRRGASEELPVLGCFTLDRAAELVPHSNAVCFGTERYAAEDEYPLLYSNIYNNYAKATDPRMGVCCVYRLVRTPDGYRTTLVQLIEIGFCQDPSLWKATADAHGVRPYGNFVIDRARGVYYAFVMRNEELGTRFFAFDLPSVREGQMDPTYRIPRVTLSPSDVRSSFDMPYYRYVQGATVHDGRIYSTEGFANDEVNRPAIRVIDPDTQSETYFSLTERGIAEEPEMIDFHDGVCYYSDYHGNFYTVAFS